ncbi:hypothetical protein [Blastopirellula retiformator]|uniref:hypothetical protein n=1 Tax=Blastopirellula retiformator TaxID=2527970 RepID=UPI0011B67E37|nr:hypothetical protein [Blastopirellula retiformator]
MTDANENPFASPPVEQQDPADAPLMDGDKIGRWLALPFISGALNGAGIATALTACFVLGVSYAEGVLLDLIAVQENRTSLGIALAMAGIYGGVLGSLSGLIHGLTAFALRKRPSNHGLTYAMGYLAPLALMWAPVFIIIAVFRGEALLWTMVVLSLLLVASACVLFGWRMNRNIRKYLLSRIADESA